MVPPPQLPAGFTETGIEVRLAGVVPGYGALVYYIAGHTSPPHDAGEVCLLAVALGLGRSSWLLGLAGNLLIVSCNYLRHIGRSSV